MHTADKVCLGFLQGNHSRPAVEAPDSETLHFGIIREEPTQARQQRFRTAISEESCRNHGLGLPTAATIGCNVLIALKVIQRSARSTIVKPAGVLDD